MQCYTIPPLHSQQRRVDIEFTSSHAVRLFMAQPQLAMHNAKVVGGRSNLSLAHAIRVVGLSRGSPAIP